jgi:hypothetical protein
MKTVNSFSGPADTYEELVGKATEDGAWLLGLVAFAVVEEQKIEWMKHHAKNNGGPPPDEEIRRWYQQQPESVLTRAKEVAQNRMTDYAGESIDIFLVEFGKETEQGIIVSEIRELQKFWPQLGMNILGGIASSLLFAALLTLMAFLILNDSSPVTIGAKLGFDAKETSHANVQGNDP